MIRFFRFMISNRTRPAAMAIVAVAGFAVGRHSRTPVLSPHDSKATATVLPGESPYLKANDVAMSRMVADMVIKPTGDVDRDFVAMMTPHHQGAIDMARAALRHGGNQQVRRLALEVIATQQRQVEGMRLAVGDPLLASGSSPAQVAAWAASPARATFFTAPE